MGVVCEQCGKTHNNKRFCSTTCYADSMRARPTHCEYCDEPIIRQNRRFCSRQCYFDHREDQKPVVACQQCGETFTVQNVAYLKRGGAKYCSRECSTRQVDLDEGYFAQINTEEKAYWLGFIYADGHNSGAALNFGLQEQDGHMVRALKTALSSGHKIAKDDTGFTTLQVSSKHLCRDLEKWGVLVGKKSQTIRLPDLDTALYSHFIRGYFDGDGWMSARQCVTCPPYWRWGIYSGSSAFISEVQETITKSCPKLDPNVKGANTLEIIGRDKFPHLLRYLYTDATVYLDRKRALIQQAVDQESDRPLLTSNSG